MITPGPWILRDRSVYDVSGIIIASAQYNPELRPHSTEQMIPNALLIAAAPELLEACKQALDLLSKCPTVTLEGIPYNSSAWRAQLSAAIAHAEGR